MPNDRPTPPEPADRRGRHGADRESAHFDVVVVGSGPGGATVARELTRRGASVLVLERGPARPITGSPAQTLREVWRPGHGVHLAGGPVAVVHGVTLGGSSVYFYGTAWDPPHERLEPFGLDLREEVDEIKHELPYTVPTLDELAPRAARLHTSARAEGLDWAPLPKFFQPGTTSAVPMGTYGAAAVDHRWNARMSVDEATALGAVLVTDARVQRVLTAGGQATGVEYVQEGRTHTARCDRVVLAAGAIGSATVLRASGITRAGHDLFYDPLIAVAGEVDDLDVDPEPPMMAGVHLEEDGVMITDMDMPPWLSSAAFAAAGTFRAPCRHRRTLTLMVKVRDELAGRITDRGGVRRPLTPADRGKLEHGREIADAVLRHAGATRTSRSGFLAAHPGATAKVGDVVDSDLQSDIGGLYVCDASVIPIPWGIPPTLTIIALGKRLAKHLAPLAEPTRTTSRR